MCAAMTGGAFFEKNNSCNFCYLAILFLNKRGMKWKTLKDLETELENILCL